MATNLRKAPGMREKQPEVWELVVEAGIDPVTGKRRQVSRTFRGNLRDAKKARALLPTEVEKGRHTGTAATVDQLFGDFLIELERKGRSPNTIHAWSRLERAVSRLVHFVGSAISAATAHRPGLVGPAA